MNAMNNLLLLRRQFLRSLTADSALLPGIVRQLLAADGTAATSPHFPPKAKRVIFLFMTGGVSHVDSFDRKPRKRASPFFSASTGNSQTADLRVVNQKPTAFEVSFRQVFSQDQRKHSGRLFEANVR